VKPVSYFSAVSVLAAVLGLGQVAGCGEQSDDDSSAQGLSQAERAAKKAKKKAVQACGLDDGTVDPDDTDLRACEPDQTHKTTICHVPPGNPANAHTLCIGTPAVKHHLANHPDYLGPCKPEIPCPPPAGGGTTGTGGATGTGGTTGTGGASGTGGAPGTGGSGEVIL
jgi:hypothetical protein